MYDWVTSCLQDKQGLSDGQREAWLITLRCYFGFCAKRQLANPLDSEAGKVFWREAVLSRQLSADRKEQCGQALRWLFEELAAQDAAGAKMRSAMRLRHLAFRTEKAYMGWLRRFMAFIHPADALTASPREVVRFLS
ncbi:phage integrase N-terminal SAM-like domain-containing protein [Cerasicoccus maritimus]|uniref:phage integrase N-terminal SAM-like domain-containing protein n=1 Tax=Cerasicoccus maritimus TaxID=490089 RepID=UPI0028525D82|nr:phage integrase N-terminal SAM-like domain-containing protein [Cerasicoccus maritimus]